MHTIYVHLSHGNDLEKFISTIQKMHQGDNKLLATFNSNSNYELFDVYFTL